MKRLFGTDGVRGVDGVELTSNIAMISKVSFLFGSVSSASS